MKKKLSALLLALVLCLSIRVPAFAYETSVSGETPVENCHIWSELYKNGSRYNALTFVQADRGNIPAEGVKVQAILYDKLGEVKASGESILTAAYPSHVADTQYRYIRESPARSQGVVYFRDPSGGYSSHQTKAAWENMSRSVATMEIAAIRVAASGKTYGSLLMAKTPEESPDLIAAIGTEGQSGYVAREDFLNPKDDRCKNPAYSGRHIPLYDLSGNIIGTFEITFSHPDTAGKDLETIKSELATGNQEDQRLWAIADKILVNGSYPVNAKGQSYGPNFLRELVGYSPDLTPAVNDDGVAGYVRCIKELPVSAAESVIRSAATSKPLYDVDGNVIGVCELATPTPVETIGKSINEIRTEIGNWPQSK